MKRLSKLILAATLATPAIGVLAAATPAGACATADPYSGACVRPVRYHVTANNGRLAVQRTPNVGNIDHWIGGNGTPVSVICQINDGGTDPYDRLTSRTWDYITDHGWVYDHFVSTPAQGAGGWSPGVRHCDERAGNALTPAIGVPGLAPRQIRALGYTAGPLFHDGPGFSNAAVPQTLSDAERIGVCQSLVLANTDYWWLMPYDVVNNVFTWAEESRRHGRAILHHPVVGAVVVFNGGWHDGWNYGTGHVAMVMRTYRDGSFTVAEFNWHAGGGGTHILDLRRISARDTAPNVFIR